MCVWNGFCHFKVTFTLQPLLHLNMDMKWLFSCTHHPLSGTQNSQLTVAPHLSTMTLKVQVPFINCEGLHNESLVSKYLHGVTGHLYLWELNGYNVVFKDWRKRRRGKEGKTDIMERSDEGVERERSCDSDSPRSENRNSLHYERSSWLMIVVWSVTDLQGQIYWVIQLHSKRIQWVMWQDREHMYGSAPHNLRDWHFLLKNGVGADTFVSSFGRFCVLWMDGVLN